MRQFAPICLFTYNRVDKTIQTVTALKKNFLAKQSDLIIFSDGPKNEDLNEQILKLRSYLKTITGFKSLEIHESKENKGLANSIIGGVNMVIKNYGRVIVLEDDLITTPNFLHFMNQALDFYEGEKKVYSISGYSMKLKSLKDYPADFYLGLRASSWGWGTWQERWQNVDWEVQDFNKFKWDLIRQYRFMKGGSDLPFMLRKQMRSKIDSWAIRWCYHQFKYGLFTVFPAKSKIKNIGFGKAATHTKKQIGKLETLLDKSNQTAFDFSKDLIRNKILEKEFKNKFSVFNRIKNRLL